MLGELVSAGEGEAWEDWTSEGPLSPAFLSRTGRISSVGWSVEFRGTARGRGPGQAVWEVPEQMDSLGV